MSAQPRLRCFVIMPYGAKFDPVYRQLILPALSDLPVLVLRADAIGRQAITLHAHVGAAVESADFCVADLTGNNPNVLYEVGYAMALQKPMILMAQSDKLSKLPTNLQDQMRLSYVRDALGKSAQALRAACVAIIEEQVMIASPQVQGQQVTLFADRQEAGIGEALAFAQRRVDILETNLNFVRHYTDAIVGAVAARDQLRIRIVTLDPDSFFAEARARQLGTEVFNYRTKLRQDLESLVSAARPWADRISLRVYNDFPTQVTYIVDDTVYSCTVTRGARSRHTATIRLNSSDRGAARSFLQHFDALWSEATPYTRSFR